MLDLALFYYIVVKSLFSHSCYYPPVCKSTLPPRMYSSIPNCRRGSGLATKEGLEFSRIAGLELVGGLELCNHVNT